jgi:aryl-alcohol dehydrogenase-like predicted oxidoreductase
MRTVDLGSTGLQVSAIGLGCMTMSEFFGPVDRDDAFATLRKAAEVGVNFLDTSDLYGIGSANEKFLGEYLQTADRDQIVLATKFGAVRDPETGAMLQLRGDPAYVREACDASLKRLGVDHIDLYYLHHPDPKTPIGETVAAMGELVKAGKVRHLGLSNISADELREGHRAHPIAAVQQDWSLFTRTIEESVAPACAELGVAVVPHSPLGRGFLTGVYTSVDGLAPDDYRRMIPRYQDENAARNAELLEPLKKIAADHGATLAQVALAWLIGQSGKLGVPVVPIPGTKRPARVAENAGAVDLVLSEAELESLEPIAGQVSGSGMPQLTPELLKLLDKD